MRTYRFLEPLTAICILILLAVSFFTPAAAHAEEKDQKVVRVGWYDSSFCCLDQFGRRCGIDYEYQTKISAYTGWTYEYVEDSWPEFRTTTLISIRDYQSSVFTPRRIQLIF